MPKYLTTNRDVSSTPATHFPSLAALSGSRPIPAGAGAAKAPSFNFGSLPIHSTSQPMLARDADESSQTSSMAPDSDYTNQVCSLPGFGEQSPLSAAPQPAAAPAPAAASAPAAQSAPAGPFIGPLLPGETRDSAGGVVPAGESPTCRDPSENVCEPEGPNSCEMEPELSYPGDGLDIQPDEPQQDEPQGGGSDSGGLSTAVNDGVGIGLGLCGLAPGPLGTACTVGGMAQTAATGSPDADDPNHDLRRGIQGTELGLGALSLLGVEAAGPLGAVLSMGMAAGDMEEYMWPRMVQGGIENNPGQFGPDPFDAFNEGQQGY